MIIPPNLISGGIVCRSWKNYSEKPWIVFCAGYAPHPWLPEGNTSFCHSLQFLPYFYICLFTFSSTCCIIAPNRVGDLALSATGTGSCPEDEGLFHDEAAAPAVA